MAGHIEFALVCTALALLVAPVPAARRRFTRVYGRSRVRKCRTAWLIRLGVGAGLPTLLLLGAGPMIAATLASATFVVRRGRAAREARRKAESVRLLEGLETVISELRVGAHPSAAAEAAAREIAVADAMRGTPDGSPVPGEPLRVAGGRAAVGGLPHGVGARISPGVTAAGGSAGDVARAFSVSAARSRLGGSGAEALRRPDSVVAVELSRLAEAWQVAESHGLALAELLAAARADLQGRNRFRERTRAALAGARATAAVLAGLPLLGVGLGQLMGAAPLLVLFDSAAGTLLLPLGVGLACAGLLWTDAITARVLR